MKKQETMFWMLRTLVRQDKLEPAFARQIYEKHLLLSGKEIPFGHAIWFGHGWAYDKSIWGNKEAAKDYYDSYKGSPYCPVDKLPSVTGYDRRAGKARVFGPCERKKAEKNYLPVEYIVETVYDEKLKKEYTEITKIKVGEKIFEIVPAHRVWDIDVKFAGPHRRGHRMYVRDESGKKQTMLLAGIRNIEVIYDTASEEVVVEERIYKDEDEEYAEKIMKEDVPGNVEKIWVAGKRNPKGLVPYVTPDVPARVVKWVQG